MGFKKRARFRLQQQGVVCYYNELKHNPFSTLPLSRNANQPNIFNWLRRWLTSISRNQTLWHHAGSYFKLFMVRQLTLAQRLAIICCETLPYLRDKVQTNEAQPLLAVVLGA